MAVHVLMSDDLLFCTHFKDHLLTLGSDRVKVVRILLAQQLILYIRQDRPTYDPQLIDLAQRLSSDACFDVSSQFLSVTLPPQDSESQIGTEVTDFTQKGDSSPVKGSTELESPALRSLNSFDPVVENMLVPEEVEKRMEEAKDYELAEDKFPSPEN